MTDAADNADQKEPALIVAEFLLRRADEGGVNLDADATRKLAFCCEMTAKRSETFRALLKDQEEKLHKLRMNSISLREFYWLSVAMVIAKVVADNINAIW